MRLPGGRKPTLKKLEGYDNGQQFQLSVFTINLAVESEEALDVLLRGIPSVKLYGLSPVSFLVESHIRGVPSRSHHQRLVCLGTRFAFGGVASGRLAILQSEVVPYMTPHDLIR